MDRYQQEKAFLLFMFNVVHRPAPNVDPSLLPAAALERMEKRSLSQARKGLRLAIDDILADSMRLSFEQVKKIDVELSERGILTLSAMRVEYSKRYKAVLGQQQLKNEQDYYMVRSILDDTDIGEAKDRDLMSTMLADYERSRARQ